jgi:hypothetical protein
MRTISMIAVVFFAFLFSAVGAAENTLTEQEQKEGWVLLFDGKTTKGWMSDTAEPLPQSHVQDGSLNPHPCKYLLLYEKPWSDFVFSCEFKITPKCNSGVFFRLWPLEPLPGLYITYNGPEIAIDDTTTAGFYDTGAIYDLVKPQKNAMKPVGEWNQLVLTCRDNLVSVDLNGERVNGMDLDQWSEAGKRPDGSAHKFADFTFKTRPRKGYIGLQDHGQDCWFRNLKLRPLDTKADPAAAK